MSTDDPSESGRAWVVEQLRSFAAETGTPITSIEWHVTAEDLRAPVQTRTLVVVIRGNRRVETFIEADLEDAPQEPEVRLALERRLRDLISTA